MKLPCSSWHVTFFRSHSFPFQHVSGGRRRSFFVVCPMLSPFHDLIVTIAHTMSAGACRTKKCIPWTWMACSTGNGVRTQKSWHEMPPMTVQKFMQRTTEQAAETNLQPLLFHIIYIYYRHRTPVFVRRLHIYFFRFFSLLFVIALFTESSAPKQPTNMHDKHRRVDFIYFQCGRRAYFLLVGHQTDKSSLLWHAEQCMNTSTTIK